KWRPKAPSVLVSTTAGAVVALGSAEQARAGRGVLRGEHVDEFRGRAHGVDHADALAAAPDLLPGLGLAGLEVHLARIARRQVVGIEPGGGDRSPQVVAMHAGEQVRVDDVV